MNQALKDRVYSLGNDEMVEWMQWFSGFSEEEKAIWQMFREDADDLEVENTLSINKSTRTAKETQLAKKLTAGVLLCIDREMHRTPMPKT